MTWAQLLAVCSAAARELRRPATEELGREVVYSLAVQSPGALPALGFPVKLLAATEVLCRARLLLQQRRRDEVSPALAVIVLEAFDLVPEDLVLLAQRQGAPERLLGELCDWSEDPPTSAGAWSTTVAELQALALARREQERGGGRASRPRTSEAPERLQRIKAGQQDALSPQRGQGLGGGDKAGGKPAGPPLSCDAERMALRGLLTVARALDGGHGPRAERVQATLTAHAEDRLDFTHLPVLALLQHVDNLAFKE